MIVELKPCTACEKLIRADKLHLYKFRKGQKYNAYCRLCFSKFKLLDELLEEMKKEEDQ